MVTIYGGFYFNVSMPAVKVVASISSKMQHDSLFRKIVHSKKNKVFSKVFWKKLLILEKNYCFLKRVLKNYFFSKKTNKIIHE